MAYVQADVPSFVHSVVLGSMIPDPPQSDGGSSILTSFFRRAAADAELAAGRVRRVVLPLVALRLVLARWSEIVDLVPKHWWALGCLAVGLMVSEWMVRAMLRAERKEPWLIASVTLDAVVAFCVLLPAVVWPRGNYPGMLAQPDWAILPVLAMASGLRLARSASWAGALASLVALVSLVGLDRAWNTPMLRYGGGEVALALVLMVAAGLVGDAIAQRVRRLVQEGAQRAVRAERTRQRLGAYVSEELAEVVMEGTGLDLGGEERELAVLFSDLRGFTTYGEQIGADALITELNDYFEALVPAVRRHGGVVDKYIGDAIMVVFGVPRATGDEACRALRAAAAMQEALEAHNAVREARGQPALRQGVGVHYGRCIAGNVGTAERLQYTVVGDTVNVASRLEGATKDAGVPVLLSESVVERARAEGAEMPAVVDHGRVPIRGRDGDQRVFTLA